MNREEFFSEFGHLALAPDGVARLRRLVLDLAVRGRLVPQDPSDEPASVLLERIAEERERLVAEKAIKKAKALPEVEGSEKLFDIPAEWKFTRVRTVTVDCGQTIPSERFTYIDVSSIDGSRGAVDYSLAKKVEPEDAPSRARKLVEQGAVIYSMVRPYLLNTCHLEVLPTPSPIVSTAFAVLKPLSGLDAAFLHLMMRSPMVLQQAESLMRGVAYPALSDKQLSSMVLPLPPTQEQKRIVEKVDELMAVCDELEEEQAKAKVLRAQTAQSSLRRVVESGREETPEAIELLQQSLGLTLRPGDGAAEALAKTREAILDLAVRGRLVPQDPSDEPASVLLERIAEERERLVAEKRIRNTKPLPEVDEHDEPFSLPTGWEWSRFGSMVEIGLKGNESASNLPPGRWIVDLEDLESGSGQVLQRLTAADRPTTSAKTNFDEGDVLYGKLRPYLNKVVIADQPGSCSTEILVLSPLASLSSRFLALSLRAPVFVRWATEISYGVKMPRLGTKALREREIAVSPLAEQTRIVEKVNELMAVCDELEHSLTTERQLSADFADSAVAALVA